MISFKCPECGSAEVASIFYVSTDWSTGGEATSPWSYVLQQIHCANTCYRIKICLEIH